MVTDMGNDEGIESDGWLRATRYLLILAGVCWLGLSALALLEGTVMFVFRMRGEDTSFVIGLIAMIVCVLVALVNFVAAVGLAYRRKWAWVTGVVLAVLYIPSLCLPFAVVMLYGLMREKVRTPFQA